VAAVLRGAEAFLVCHLAVLLLRLERRGEHGERALARGVRLLVRKRGLEHRAVPALRPLGHLRNGHLLVPLRHALDVLVLPRRSRSRFVLGRRSGLLRGRLRRLLRGAAERDLDARHRRTEARVALVAGPPPVLADANLRAALVRHDPRRHGPAVAEEDVRRERLALVGADAVDEQRLALADAVLLAADTGDGVVHSADNAGVRPASASSVAGGSTRRRGPTPTSACSSRPRRRPRRTPAPAPG